MRLTHDGRARLHSIAFCRYSFCRKSSLAFRNHSPPSIEHSAEPLNNRNENLAVVSVSLTVSANCLGSRSKDVPSTSIRSTSHVPDSPDPSTSFVLPLLVTTAIFAVAESGAKPSDEAHEAVIKANEIAAVHARTVVGSVRFVASFTARPTTLPFACNRILRPALSWDRTRLRGQVALGVSQ